MSCPENEFAWERAEEVDWLTAWPGRWDIGDDPEQDAANG